jgi:hypothetical protein
MPEVRDQNAECRVDDWKLATGNWELNRREDGLSRVPEPGPGENEVPVAFRVRRRHPPARPRAPGCLPQESATRCRSPLRRTRVSGGCAARLHRTRGYQGVPHGSPAESATRLRRRLREGDQREAQRAVLVIVRTAAPGDESSRFAGRVKHVSQTDLEVMPRHKGVQPRPALLRGSSGLRTLPC